MLGQEVCCVGQNKSHKKQNKKKNSVSRFVRNRKSVYSEFDGFLRSHTNELGNKT